MQCTDLTIITGSLLLVGTLCILMFRKTYVDPKTNEPIEFELPILGKIKAQSPLLLLIAVGAASVFYGAKNAQDLAKNEQELAKQQGGERFTVTGAIRIAAKPGTTVPMSKDILLYFIGIPNYQYQQHGTTETSTFTTTLPLVQGMTYRAKYVVDDQLVGDREVKIKNKVADLGEFTYEINPERNTQVQPRIEVSDAVKSEFLPK